MHTPNHTHAPLPKDMNTAFKVAIALNIAYVLIEAGSGLACGSLALLADAAHNLTDVAGLLMAWGAVLAAQKPGNGSYTYGYGRATILAALVNALVIMLGVGAVILEAVQRLASPTPVAAGFVMGVAALGIAVNAGTALLFFKQRHGDLNAEGAFLHMMTDAAVSLGVVLGGGIVLFTGWAWVDPAVAVIVSLMVALATYSLLKASLRLTLDGVPTSVNRNAVQAWLASQPGISSVHDLHIWALSTTKNALTAHLVMPQGPADERFLSTLAEELESQFNIHHTTIQLEANETACCTSCCANEKEKS